MSRKVLPWKQLKGLVPATEAPRSPDGLRAEAEYNFLILVTEAQETVEQRMDALRRLVEEHVSRYPYGVTGHPRRSNQELTTSGKRA